MKVDDFRLLRQNMHALHDEKHCLTIEAKYWAEPYYIAVHLLSNVSPEIIFIMKSSLM